MGYFSNLKTLAVAAGFAAISSVASAAVVATFDVVGDYSFDYTKGGFVFFAEGSFYGEDFGLDPFLTTDYLFSASLSIDGSPVFDESIPAYDTSLSDLVDEIVVFLNLIDPGIVPVLNDIADVITDGDGIPVMLLPNVDFPSAPDVWFSFLLENLVITPTTISGDFATYVSPFEFPDRAHEGPDGTFALSLTIEDIAVVPLPASLPLLGGALFALAALRRRKKAA